MATQVRRRRKKLPSDPLENANSIRFPKKDQNWISLQEKVIAAAGKPIEDLKCRDLQGLYASLTADEGKAVRKYRAERNLLAPLVVGETLLGEDEDWEERVCRKTWEFIHYFTDCQRVIVVRLGWIQDEKQEKDYQSLISTIKRELLALLAAYPGMKWVDSKWNDLECVRVNIGLVPPTNAGKDLIQSICDRLEARENELKQQAVRDLEHLKEAQQTSAVQSEKLRERQNNFYDVLKLGRKAGVIVKKSGAVYFEGKVIGKDYWQALTKAMNDFDLEAAIRVAVKTAIAQKAAGKSA
jgi:hypothetical protein